jgi:hypothetical protein
MGYGILNVGTKILEEVLHLPEGYDIISVQYEPYTRTLQCVVESNMIRVPEEGHPLPRLMMTCSVEYAQSTRCKTITCTIGEG